MADDFLFDFLLVGVLRDAPKRKGLFSGRKAPRPRAGVFTRKAPRPRKEFRRKAPKPRPFTARSDAFDDGSQLKVKPLTKHLF